MHPEAHAYAKRLLADAQTLPFVPEWAEQVANVELEFGDVFCLGSKINDWFLSLDLRQFRAAFFTQTVAPCRVELSDDEGDDDLEGENENYICTLLDEDGWECGPPWPTVLALAALTVLSSTFLLTPSAHDVIPSLTTQQNSSAILLLWNIRLPRSFTSDQCRNPDSACRSDLWQKIRDRWRARRAERETKTQQTAACGDEGRRDDGELGAEGIRQGRQQEHGREATQRRPQDALRTLSASAGSQRRSLRVLDD